MKVTRVQSVKFEPYVIAIETEAEHIELLFVLEGAYTSRFPGALKAAIKGAAFQ